MFWIGGAGGSAAVLFGQWQHGKRFRSPGHTLLFHFDAAGQTIEKTYTVAGIAYFPSTRLFYCTREAIAEISPYNNTSHLSVFCDPDYKESVQDEIMALISGNPNLRLKIYDEEFSTIRGFIKASTSSLYGISASDYRFALAMELADPLRKILW